MRALLIIAALLCTAQSYTLYKMEESLEVADLIIIATEHQRNEAQERVRILEQAIIEQNDQCREQPPRFFRGPAPVPQQPQQNQEDKPSLST